MRWKSKTLLAKIETTYGTDPTPTGAANAVLAMNVSINPMEGQDVKRDVERPYFGADPTIPAGVHTTLEFDVELVGSGTLGTAPAWGPLLRMCSVAEVITAGTKVEYNPITNNPESGTIYFQADTTRHLLTGVRGTAQIKLSAQGIPMIHFVMIGLYSTPTEQAIPTVSFTAWQAPQIASKLNTPTFTIGGAAFVLRDLSIDLGNQVEPRMLIGSESIQVTDKDESISVTVEAVPVTTYNPYTIAQNQTLQALQLIHGTVAATRVKFDATSIQQARPTGYQANQNIIEWPLKFTPLPTAGNDQWKITLS